MAEDATWQAEDIEHRDGLTQFNVVARRTTCSADSSRRCLASTTCAMRWPPSRVGAHVGLSQSALAEGLRAFKGIKRRLETVAWLTALRCSTTSHITRRRCTRRCRRCARAIPGRRIWAVFEPRSASSCRRVFQDDFARAFGQADQVILAAVFRSTLAGVRAPRRDATRRRSSGARQAGPSHPGHRRPSSIPSFASIDPATWLC